LQLLVLVFSVKVKVVLAPEGNGEVTPPVVTHGVWTQAPAVPPQSASLLQGPNLFAAALVVHSFTAQGPLLTLIML
jgi:hypothetical protein